MEKLGDGKKSISHTHLVIRTKLDKIKSEFLSFLLQHYDFQNYYY